MIIIGVIIGVILTLVIIEIQSYLKFNHLKMNWRNVFIYVTIILFVTWLIYGFIGMAIGPKYTKLNGNTCQGYKYVFKHCWGNIGAE